MYRKYRPNVSISEFSGVKISDLSDIEELFQINITVYELEPVESERGDDTEEEESSANAAATTATSTATTTTYY